MEVGRISGLVAALESELKYYRGLAKEQQEIIEQLHRGYALPGRPTYIHPADLAEIFNNSHVFEMLDVYLGPPQEDVNLIKIQGTVFKQSASMPKITTKF